MTEADKRKIELVLKGVDLDGGSELFDVIHKADGDTLYKKSTLHLVIKKSTVKNYTDDKIIIHNFYNIFYNNPDNGIIVDFRVNNGSKDSVWYNPQIMLDAIQYTGSYQNVRQFNTNLIHMGHAQKELNQVMDLLDSLGFKLVMDKYMWDAMN